MIVATLPWCQTGATMNIYMVEEVKLTVRLPVSIRDNLVQRATIDRRSLNSELICILEAFFKADNNKEYLEQN